MKDAFVARDFVTLQLQITRIPDGIYLARRYIEAEGGNVTIFLQNEKTSESYYIQVPPIAQVGGKKR